MIERTVSADEPKAVQVASPQVWLRKNIQKQTYETADAGEAKSYTAWEADEVTFIDPTVTEAYATEHFDELWAAHESDGKTDAERIADAEAYMDEIADAIADLSETVSDKIAGKE